MPRPSHSTEARSRYVFEPDLSTINSSRAHTEQRHTAANMPYHPEPHPVAVPCLGPRACCLPLTCRTHGHGCHECDEVTGFSPYGQDVPRHVCHRFENPEPEFHQHHQYDEADPLGSSRRGRLYHRASSCDVADRGLEFDRRGRSGHYSPPQYDSANDDPCFDDVHGSHRNNESPVEPQSLASFFGVKFGPPGPDSRSQDRENRDTNRDRSRRSRSLGRGSMGPPLGSFPDHTDLEYFQHHERDGMGPSLVTYPDYAADDLEDNLSEAFIHRPRLARRRGRHSDSDVETIDTDTEEEYFKHIRHFDFVDDAIADRYTGRLRDPTAAEKSHRRYLVSLSKDFDRQYLRAEEARAELWLLKRQDTHVAQSDTEDDSTPERVARQARNMRSPGIHLVAADFSTGLLKESPRGRRDAQQSDSESITPQPQDSHPQVRHQVAAHPTTTNHNQSSHRKHNKPTQPHRAPNRPTRPQQPQSNSNTALPKDQAPPSYDSVPPAQVTDSVQPYPVNDTPRSPFPTAGTESTTLNTAKATPRSHGEDLLLQNLMRGTRLESLEGQPELQISLIEYSSPPTVRIPPCDKLHTCPAELGSNGHSDGSDSGAATPVTSSDDDDNDDDDTLKNVVFY